MSQTSLAEGFSRPCLLLAHPTWIKTTGSCFSILKGYIQGSQFFHDQGMVSNSRTFDRSINENTQSKCRSSNASIITMPIVTANNTLQGPQTSGLSTQIISTLSHCLLRPQSLIYPQGDDINDAATIYTLS